MVLCHAWWPHMALNSLWLPPQMVPFGTCQQFRRPLEERFPCSKLATICKTVLAIMPINSSRFSNGRVLSVSQGRQLYRHFSNPIIFDLLLRVNYMFQAPLESARKEEALRLPYTVCPSYNYYYFTLFLIERLRHAKEETHREIFPLWALVPNQDPGHFPLLSQLLAERWVGSEQPQWATDGSLAH